ncbi:YidC/Oxa1 family membrane protein insertase [Desulfosporosinus sp. FKB]|uniref:YidC/Oxa1 family membrane protein insertase n=1 Tax=Desulfosporosinus sp. FKB TaxID=1969835 RepID=UPI000B4A02C9|nr:YidC/Oxa1 family membrane protein insertase [Desulfosporosinus sp. FKB]
MHMFGSLFSLILGSLINLTGDWFLAVALLTFGLKLLLFPLSVNQQRTQLLSANLSQVKSVLTVKFHNKTEKVNSELLKISSKYKVNSFISFLPFIIQAPILFSFYFSVLNLSSSVGSFLLPWVSGVHAMDNLHILPAIAGFFQGVNGFTSSNRNFLSFLVPVIIGLIFLWKAPAALSAYWIVNSALGLTEKQIFSLRAVRKRLFNIPTPEQMIEETV